MGSYTYLDRALLKSEWNQWSKRCPVCGDTKHALDCDMDLALAERGFPLKEDRDRVRDEIAGLSKA